MNTLKFVTVSTLLAWSSLSLAATKELLNVSYDPTRELYTSINQAYGQYWKNKTGDTLIFKQSHGGSGKQARAVIDGLNADVVTLALAADIDAIAEKTQKIPLNWQKSLPENSTPYTSTIVFLVRKNNPKQIHDWNDLIRPDVAIITPNPKTGGGARWNYLAAWAWSKHQPNGNDQTAQTFVQKIYKNTRVLDSGARGSTTTFTERNIGDVLITWENEAFLAQKEQPEKFEIITPSLSILAEPTVALVNKNAKKKGNYYAAKGYLNFLYSPIAQNIIAQNYYRPRNKDTLKKYDYLFKPLHLVTIDQEFGGWKKVQKIHFDTNGIFDQIIKANQH